MTNTKLHLMNWPLINHFRRKKPNNMFKLLYIHSFLLHFIIPLFGCWLLDKSTFLRKCKNFNISLHITYMSLTTHITCFWDSSLTQQHRSEGPNYLSQNNLSNMAPNPPKALRGATQYQVQFSAAVEPSAFCSVTNYLY